MYRPKQTVEGTKYISISDIKNLGAGNTYTLSWNDESINIDRHPDNAVIRYIFNDERISSYVGIDTTKVGYGIRSWLNCPACERRTAKIYLVKGLFACRHCHDLTYMTCQASGNRMDYLGIKIRRLQKRLGIDVTKGYVDIQEKPLFKPKNMHQRTW